MPEREKRSMSDRIRRQIAYYENRCARMPDHPQKEFMESEIKRLNSELQQPDMPQDRLLNRADTLVQSIRKLQARLEANPNDPKRESIEFRLGEYRASLTNIKEYGTERPKASQIVGATINIPTDVMVSKSGGE